MISDKNRQRRVKEYNLLDPTKQDRMMKYHEEITKKWEETGKKLAEKVGRDPSTLSMFSDEDYRRKNEERYIISQVVNQLGTKEPGIWKPLARIGDLYAQPENLTYKKFTMIRNPEQREDVPGVRPNDFFHSRYYLKRVKQLRSFIEKIKPHEPDAGLIVVGQPLEMTQFEQLPEVEDKLEEVYENEVKESEEYVSTVKVNISSNRLFFRSSPGKSVAKTIEIKNIGTTAIYYQWEISPDPELMIGAGTNRNPVKFQQNDKSESFDWKKSESFSMAKDLLPRTRSEFGFTKLSGSIRPGNSDIFSFVFKSDVPGCFTQKWVMRVTPKAEANSFLSVSLRGCCEVEPPNLSAFKASIDASLHESERVRCIEEVFTSIFDRIQQVIKIHQSTGEDRIDGDVLIDDRAPNFENINKKWNLTYSPGLYASLYQIAEECWDNLGISGFDRFWDMNVESLTELALKIADGNIKRQLLKRINELLLESTSISNAAGNLTYSLAFVKISYLTDKVANIANTTSLCHEFDMPPFIVPKIVEANPDDDLDSTRRRRKNRRMSVKKPAKKTQKQIEEEEAALRSARVLGQVDIPSEVRESMKDQIKASLIESLKSFELLAGESKGVAQQLTRKNEMDILDTNLDAEVEDELLLDDE